MHKKKKKNQRRENLKRLTLDTQSFEFPFVINWCTVDSHDTYERKQTARTTLARTHTERDWRLGVRDLSRRGRRDVSWTKSKRKKKSEQTRKREKDARKSYKTYSAARFLSHTQFCFCSFDSKKRFFFSFFLRILLETKNKKKRCWGRTNSQEDEKKETEINKKKIEEKEEMGNDAERESSLSVIPPSTDTPLCLCWLREVHSRTFFPSLA